MVRWVRSVVVMLTFHLPVGPECSYSAANRGRMGNLFGKTAQAVSGGRMLANKTNGTNNGDCEKTSYRFHPAAVGATFQRVIRQMHHGV